jgi:hypothetical protein
LNSTRNLQEFYTARQPLIKLRNYPFYYLISLTYVNLFWSSIESIPVNAYHFRNESEDIINIWLSFGVMNESYIEQGAFQNLKRLVHLLRLCYDDLFGSKDFFLHFSIKIRIIESNPMVMILFIWIVMIAYLIGLEKLLNIQKE